MDLSRFAQRNPKIADFLFKIPVPLLDGGQLMTLSAGQVAVWQEDPVEYAYFLLSGELITFGETEEGKKSNFITLDAPNMISDLELLAGIPSFATNVMAGTSCTLLRCSAALVSQYLERDLPFLRMVANLCCHKSYYSAYYQGKSAFRSSLDRAAIYLLRYCSRHMPAPGQGTVVAKTRQAISSELIMSVKTVDRCLLRLQEKECLTIVRGKVHISAEQYENLSTNWAGGERV